MEDETNVDSKGGTKRGKAGNDSSFSSFGQDCFQIHQDESTTKTKATGGIETDTRTNGDHEQGQDNFQLHQEEDNTKDGIGDYKGTGNKLHQAENKAGTRIKTGDQDQDGISDFQQG